jgi:hypothetical protein
MRGSRSRGFPVAVAEPAAKVGASTIFTSPAASRGEDECKQCNASATSQYWPLPSATGAAAGERRVGSALTQGTAACAPFKMRTAVRVT